MASISSRLKSATLTSVPSGRTVVTIRSVNLDQVRTIIELFADGFARFEGTVDRLHADGNSHFRRIAFQAIPTGRRNAARGDFEAWTWNEPLVDRVAHIDVAVHGAFGFDIAIAVKPASRSRFTFRAGGDVRYCQDCLSRMSS